MEIELKLEVDPADADRLAEATLLGGASREIEEMVSIYFDTPDQHLRRAGFGLRIRHVGDRRIQTVKAEGSAAAGLFVRPEWEREVAGDVPELDPTSGPLAEMVPAEVLAAVTSVFETRVTRTRFDLLFEGAAIELAIDRGEAVAGQARTPICELELELKSGDPRALFDLARRLDDHVPQRLGVRSKSERGYALVGKPHKGAFKAEAIVLDRDGDARDAFAAIAQSCLRQFRLNEVLVRGSGAAGPVHQARVGLRRLRSAFSLFKGLLDGDARAPLLVLELKWLAAELGEVRNLDVLIPRMEEAVRPQLEAARQRALDHAQSELASARTRLLMLDLAEWLATGDWRLKPADQAEACLSAPEAAADILDRHRRKIRKRGKNLAKLDDHDRHEVRIEGKKLRYAAEFFGSLYPGKKARRRHKDFLSAIEALQDLLGELNDMATGPDVLDQLGIEAELPTPAGNRKALRRDAEDALDTLIDVKPFWRS